MKSEILNKAVQFIDHYLGWRSWSVLVYNSVIENVFLIFYIAGRNQMYTIYFIIDFFVFFLFSMFSTTYGYLINDLADRELDMQHGKANTFINDSRAKAHAIVLLFFALSVIFGVPFFERPYFLTLWLLWLLLATIYSVKPIRLKERGKLGLIIVVLAQRVLPTLIIFAAFGYYDSLDIVIFTAYIFFRGLSSDVNHQLEDYRRDAATDTRTFTVEAGYHKAERILHLSLKAEKVLLLACLLIMYQKFPSPEVLGISLFLPLVVVYCTIYGLSWWQMRRHSGDMEINPFSRGGRNIFHILHHTFPSVLMPLCVLMLLMLRNWIFFIPFENRMHTVSLDCMCA